MLKTWNSLVRYFSMSTTPSTHAAIGTNIPSNTFVTDNNSFIDNELDDEPVEIFLSSNQNDDLEQNNPAETTSAPINSEPTPEEKSSSLPFESSNQNEPLEQKNSVEITPPSTKNELPIAAENSLSPTLTSLPTDDKNSSQESILPPLNTIQMSSPKTPTHLTINISPTSENNPANQTIETPDAIDPLLATESTPTSQEGTTPTSPWMPPADFNSDENSPIPNEASTQSINSPTPFLPKRRIGATKEEIEKKSVYIPRPDIFHAPSKIENKSSTKPSRFCGLNFFCCTSRDPFLLEKKIQQPNAPIELAAKTPWHQP